MIFRMTKNLEDIYFTNGLIYVEYWSEIDAEIVSRTWRRDWGSSNSQLTRRRTHKFSLWQLTQRFKWVRSVTSIYKRDKITTRLFCRNHRGAVISPYPLFWVCWPIKILLVIIMIYFWLAYPLWHRIGLKMSLLWRVWQESLCLIILVFSNEKIKAGTKFIKHLGAALHND